MIWRRIDRECGIRRGPGEFFGSFTETRADGVLADVVAMGVVVARVFDAAKREALFPDGHFGFESEGEAPFDVLHGLLDGDVGRGREEEMEVVGHEDEGVELVAAFGAVVVEELEEEVGVVVDLEEAAAISGNGGDEEGADFLRGEVHEGEVRAGRRETKDYVGAVGTLGECGRI